MPDAAHSYGYVRFKPSKDGAITFSITSTKSINEAVNLMKMNKSGYKAIIS